MDGNAIVYCEGAFGSTEGKVAHALVRYTNRYRVKAVIDSKLAGQDAGFVLSGLSADIPIVASLDEALAVAVATGKPATHYVVAHPGNTPMSRRIRNGILEGLRAGLHVDCGLQDFISDDQEIVDVAANKRVNIRDIRKPPAKEDLHPFDGRKLKNVAALKIAVLGTDDAVGKQTTARCLVQQLEEYGRAVSLIGTSVTSWMQGYRHSVIVEPIINEYVHGEIEHTIYDAWKRDQPYAMVIEGQGSLMTPDKPGGFDILAAAKPDVVILQHLPKPRRKSDVKPRPLKDHIYAIEMLTGSPVAAISLNPEGLTDDEVNVALRLVKANTGIPCFDVLRQGAGGLLKAIDMLIKAA